MLASESIGHLSGDLYRQAQTPPPSFDPLAEGAIYLIMCGPRIHWDGLLPVYRICALTVTRARCYRRVGLGFPAVRTNDAYGCCGSLSCSISAKNEHIGPVMFIP